MKELKRTPLFDVHRKLGARLVPFAGFEMPLQYTGIIDEHLWVRSRVGVFDVSHMGEFEVKGRDALQFVSYVTSNDPSTLREYEVQYSTFLNERGGIVDDLLVYRLKDRFLLVVNASNIEKDFAHIEKYASKFDVELSNISSDVAELAVQGPESQSIIQKFVNIDLEKLHYYWAAEAKFMGYDVLISRTGYTGEDGFEIYLAPDHAEEVFLRLLDEGEVKPAGLGARDSLRMEMGYCLYGNDINEDTNPYEARLGWIVKLDKGDFVGREALLKIKENGVRRRRVGFETVVKGAFPRPHFKIKADGREVGDVTSGGYSPSLKKGIGMGYVPRELSKPGQELLIPIRGKDVPFTVVRLPFYKNGTVRSGR